MQLAIMLNPKRTIDILSEWDVMSGKSEDGQILIKTGPYASIEALPVKTSKRTWGATSYAALWLNMSVTVPTFMLGAAFTLAGIAPITAILCIAAGAAFMAVLSILSAHPGTAYGIPFGILTRVAFGIKGSQLPNMLRAIVATGWYGILLWLGADALDALTMLLYPPWESVAYHTALWFALFTAATIVAVAYFKPGKANRLIATLNYVSTPMLLLGGLAWFALLLRKVGQDNLLLIINAPGEMPWQTTILAFLSSAAFFWSTAALNISDFSRFASSQRNQAAGQAAGIIAGFSGYGALGVLCSAMTLSAFGESLWIPTTINPELGSFFTAFMLVAIVLGSLRTNIAANNTAINMAFVSLSPDNINWLRATVISTVIALMIQPWLLIATWQTYIYLWVVVYGTALGSVLSVMLTDYYILRRRGLDLQGLYNASGSYWHHSGYGIFAILSISISSSVPVASLIVFGITPLYALGPFVSMAIAALLYLLLAYAGVRKSDDETL